MGMRRDVAELAGAGVAWFNGFNGFAAQSKDTQVQANAS
jgi:hypothetical protein